MYVLELSNDCLCVLQLYKVFLIINVLVCKSFFLFSELSQSYFVIYSRNIIMIRKTFRSALCIAVVRICYFKSKILKFAMNS